MRLTLQTVLQQPANTPIYVVNKTRGPRRGPVIFNCPKQSGKGSDLIQVPDTFLPINLVDQIERAQIVSASDFRKAVQSEKLYLIDEAEAMEILSKPGVGEEMERVRGLSAQYKGALSNNMGEVNKKVDDNAIDENLNARMQNLISRIGDSGEIAVINSLRAIELDLSTADLEYLKSWSKQRGFSKLQNFATNCLANGA